MQVRLLACLEAPIEPFSQHLTTLPPPRHTSQVRPLACLETFPIVFPDTSTPLSLALSLSPPPLSLSLSLYLSHTRKHTHTHAHTHHRHCVTRLAPETAGAPSAMVAKPLTLHPILTAETHNFPSGVAPFPGAETGAFGPPKSASRRAAGPHLQAHQPPSPGEPLRPAGAIGPPGCATATPVLAHIQAQQPHRQPLPLDRSLPPWATPAPPPLPSVAPSRLPLGLGTHLVSPPESLPPQAPAGGCATCKPPDAAPTPSQVRR